PLPQRHPPAPAAAVRGRRPVRFELLRDVAMVRRGWRWGGPRPASWPEPTPGIPEPASNLDWARQEPVRSLRWLLQRGVAVPFSRSGSAQGVLHSSSMLLKSGWNLLLYAEGTRSPEGGQQPFLPGVGHLASETRAPVVPVHVKGTHRVMPKGRRYFLPAPVTVRIGRPMSPRPDERSRAFTGRVEEAVRRLGAGSGEPEVVGGWIDRWRASAPPAGGRR